MAVLRYWHGYEWRSVGGKSTHPDYVPLTGGTITGDLSVDSGDSWEMQVGSPGTIMVGNIVVADEGHFDGNVRLSDPKRVDLGGAVATNSRDPFFADSAATKAYVDKMFSLGAEAYQPETLLPGWRTHSTDYSPPGCRRSASGGLAVLEGVVVATQTSYPGAAGPMFVLPVGFRPLGRTIFMVVGGSDALRGVEVLPTGEVMLGSGPPLDTDDYVSLDGCRYPAVLTED